MHTPFRFVALGLLVETVLGSPDGRFCGAISAGTKKLTCVIRIDEATSTLAFEPNPVSDQAPIDVPVLYTLMGTDIILDDNNAAFNEFLAAVIPGVPLTSSAIGTTYIPESDELRTHIHFTADMVLDMTLKKSNCNFAYLEGTYSNRDNAVVVRINSAAGTFSAEWTSGEVVSLDYRVGADGILIFDKPFAFDVYVTPGDSLVLRNDDRLIVLEPYEQSM